MLKRKFEPNMGGLVLAASISVLAAACSSSSDDKKDSSNPPVNNDPSTSNDPAEPVFSALIFDEDSADVVNMYFPLIPGTSATYEGINDEGDVETVVTTVSHETREIAGIESRIVVDREYEDGELVEETFDWYAEDIEGNVWYMGEASTEYEDEEPVSTDGSWETGVDVDNTGQVGQAGIIMKAMPVVGDTYQHEIYPGVAEDGAEVVSLNTLYTFRDGSTAETLQIQEFDPLEPDGDDEYKYYILNQGLIAEENIDGSDRIELISRSDQAMPDIDPDDFTDSTTIDNPYLPYVPGAVYNYEVETDEGLEEILVEVLTETREVMGVTTRVVRDRVFIDGLLIEDTRDWFAQDDDGNVWYFGEAVDNFEYDDDGELEEVDHEGAWEAGIDGAQPGIVMLAEPRVGDSYRQEFLPGEAEDLGAVVAMDVEITLEDGRQFTTLKTRDWNPLEDESGDEFKYYAEGIGLVREEEEDGEEQVDLISFDLP